jgi:hypothetical protein
MYALMMVLMIALITSGHDVLFAADMPKSSAEQEFCKIDKNNDREISRDEFATCEFYKLEHVRALPLMDMNDLKKDNNGIISDADLKAYLFNKADVNKNGKIDRKEWEEFYNSLTEPGGGGLHKNYDKR